MPALLPLAERKKRAKYVLGALKRLYPNPKPPLHHEDAYTLLVAVALSAQSTDAGVNQATPGLFALADTPKKMAALTPERIHAHIKRVNYAPTKSRNLHAMAQMLMSDFGGKVPQTMEELETLPGVGHKTASVVMSQAFGQATFPVDTHIHRLAQRWKLSAGKNVVVTENDLKEVFPENTWRDVHLQIIYYGREYCTAKGCDGHTCKICKYLNSE
ncbi:MAG: endonuclease III [Bdellovibrionales bacterium]|nr:endonuclease III [Bdellovibrionales bacterium]